MITNYPEIYLKKTLEEVKTIAVVGASAKKERDSYKVMEVLIKNGYILFPVNPNETGNLILGRECLADIEDIKEKIDLVDIFRDTEAVMGIAKQAIKIGAKVLWMQEGIIHQEAADIAKNAGLKVIIERYVFLNHIKLKWFYDLRLKLNILVTMSLLSIIINLSKYSIRLYRKQFLLNKKIFGIKLRLDKNTI